MKLSLESGKAFFIDDFLGGGRQALDLADLALWPTEPPSAHPDAMTRGEQLMHVLFEARQSALGGAKAESHAKAIEAENAYRKEQGQTSALRMPPDDYKGDSNLRLTPPLAWITFQFDNGYTETVLFAGFPDKDGKKIPGHAEPMVFDPLKIERHAPTTTP